jgi:hypothetical protein
MKMKYLLTFILAFGFAITVWGQQSTAPPSNPADSGPTLAATMQYIQEKLSEQGQVGWAETGSNHPGMIMRSFFIISDIMADPAACSLQIIETADVIAELPKGKALKPGFTADDLHTHTVETDAISFKQVEKITVEKREDEQNLANAQAGFPEVKMTVTPPVFLLVLWASNASVVTTHTSTATGKQAPTEKDATNKTDGIVIRDEETANKIAKAMTHAMELCGGGGAKKELF